MLELSDIHLEAGARGLSHVFSEASITVVLGRNHSGKTRLSRLIAGLEPAQPGSIRIGGEDVTRVSPGARSVALVYQAFVNYPQWTVYQNLASPLVAQRLGRTEMRDQVAAIADQLGLGELLERLPGSLSGGQQQRVAIGRALAKRARVLVMDEPLVNLDYKLREALTSELRSLLHRAGLTVIYTTSDPRDAFALGDEVVLLAAHEAVQCGTPLQVYEAPASPAAMDLMSDPGANRRERGDVLQMVRPEHLSLEPGGADDRQFPATVLSRETNGSETYLHCDVAGSHWVAKLEGLVEVPVDDGVTLYAPAEAVFEFSAEVRVG